MDTYWGSGSKELYSGTLSIQLNSWNHYCSSRKGSAVKVYMDGKMVMSGNTGGTKTIKAGKWYLGTHVGARNSAGQYFVHGSMCSFRVYDRALDDQDIKSMFNLGACDGLQPNIEAGLIYHLPLDEGKGLTTKVKGSLGGESPTAKLLNGAAWDVAAPHGVALKLDGKKSYVLAPAIKGNPELSDMTGCVWARFASTNSGGKRQYMIDTKPHTFILLVDEVKSGTTIKVDTWFGSPGKELYSDDVTVKMDAWNHFCGARRNGASEVRVA